MCGAVPDRDDSEEELTESETEEGSESEVVVKVRQQLSFQILILPSTFSVPFHLPFSFISLI